MGKVAIMFFMAVFFLVATADAAYIKVFTADEIQLKPFDCEEESMIRVYQKGTSFCECPVGHYLSLRNALDVSTARCLQCKNCANDTHSKHEIQPCGKYTNTVCCPKPDMVAEMTSYGYQACRPLTNSSKMRRNSNT